MTQEIKVAEKLRDFFHIVRPHINGHNTAIELFFNVVDEVEKLESNNHSFSQGLLEWIEYHGWEALRANEWFVPMTENPPINRQQLITKYINSKPQP